MNKQEADNNTTVKARSGYVRIVKRLGDEQKPAQTSYTGEIHLG